MTTALKTTKRNVEKSSTFILGALTYLIKGVFICNYAAIHLVGHQNIGIFPHLSLFE